MSHTYWCIKWVLISLVLITLVHYLYNFFTNTLTIPKVKDLIDKPNKRYDELYSTIHNKDVTKGRSSGSNNNTTAVADIHNISDINNTHINSNTNSNTNSTNNTNSFTGDSEKKTMQVELKNFLNDLKQHPKQSGSGVSTLSDENHSNVYSVY